MACNGLVSHIFSVQIRLVQSQRIFLFSQTYAQIIPELLFSVGVACDIVNYSFSHICHGGRENSNTGCYSKQNFTCLSTEVEVEFPFTMMQSASAGVIKLVRKPTYRGGEHIYIDLGGDEQKQHHIN